MATRRGDPLPPSVRGHLQIVATVAGALALAPALAQESPVEVSLGARLGWTSNAELGAAGGHDDTILELRPRITMQRQGAGLTLRGSAGLNAVAYAGGTQDSRVRPEADLSARLVAIERLFFVEAGYKASQGSVDPFGARGDTIASTNAQTTTQLRLAPIVEAEGPAGIRYGLRSDNTWTRELDANPTAPTARGYFGRHAGYLERVPQPLGWKFYAERSRTRYTEGTEPEVTADLARFTLLYALNSDVLVGVRAGRERNDVLNDSPSRNFAGAELSWKPSQRTSLTASLDDRYFGTGWSLGLSHRSPFIAWNVSSSRDVESTTQSLFALPAGTNVSSLLDAMFTTRYPDPAERARVVQDFIRQQGLPASTLNPISLSGQRFSLVSRHSASIGLIGARNSLVVSGYRVTTRDVPDSVLLVTGLAQTNNVQHGAGVAFGHRLTPRAAVNLSLDVSRIRALDEIGGEQTTQRDLGLQFSVQATPKTTAYVGGRYRKLESNVVVDGREGLVFVGIDHRF